MFPGPMLPACTSAPDPVGSPRESTLPVSSLICAGVRPRLSGSIASHRARMPFKYRPRVPVWLGSASQRRPISFRKASSRITPPLCAAASFAQLWTATRSLFCSGVTRSPGLQRGPIAVRPRRRCSTRADKRRDRNDSHPIANRHSHSSLTSDRSPIAADPRDSRGVQAGTRSIGCSKAIARLHHRTRRAPETLFSAAATARAVGAHQRSRRKNPILRITAGEFQFQ